MFSKKESDKDRKLDAPRELPDLASDKYPFDEPIPKLSEEKTSKESAVISSTKRNVPLTLPDISVKKVQKKHLPELDMDLNIEPVEEPKLPKQAYSSPKRHTEYDIPDTTNYISPTKRYDDSCNDPDIHPPNVKIIEKPVIIEKHFIVEKPVYHETKVEPKKEEPIRIEPVKVEPKEEEPKKESKKEEPKPEPRVIEQKNEPIQKMSPSFFSKFEELFSQNLDQTKIIDEIINKDLLHKMREYHDSITTDTPFFLHTKDLVSGISDKVSRLQLLEQEWYSLRGELKELQKQVFDKEDEISKEIAKLKNIFFIIKTREKINKKIRPGEYFLLKDGQILKTIDDLLIELKSIKPEIYSHHVNEYKNDFANWIEGVFEIKELADRLRTTKSKEEMIKILTQVTF